MREIKNRERKSAHASEKNNMQAIMMMIMMMMMIVHSIDIS